MYTESCYSFLLITVLKRLAEVLDETLGSNSHELYKKALFNTLIPHATQLTPLQDVCSMAVRGWVQSGLNLPEKNIEQDMRYLVQSPSERGVPISLDTASKKKERAEG
jgi:hypothetical protein